MYIQYIQWHIFWQKVTGFIKIMKNIMNGKGNLIGGMGGGLVCYSRRQSALKAKNGYLLSQVWQQPERLFDSRNTKNGSFTSFRMTAMRAERQRMDTCFRRYDNSRRGRIMGGIELLRATARVAPTGGRKRQKGKEWILRFAQYDVYNYIIPTIYLLFIRMITARLSILP
jgi:hypothetical protein